MSDNKDNLIISPYFQPEQLKETSAPVFDMRLIVEIGKVCATYGYKEFNIQATNKDGVVVVGHGKFVKKQ
jgi:hypothetical protein